MKKINLKKQKKIDKTVQDFIPFTDVWNNLIYLDNGNIVGGLNIGSINLSLLFDEEQKIKVNELKKVLNSIEYPYKIFSIDKPINLDNNLNILNNKIKNTNNKIKVRLLEEDYNFISDLNKNKWVYNREFYLMIEDVKDNENILSQKLNDIALSFNSIGLTTKRINTEELKDLLYILLNPVSPLEIFKNNSTDITRPFKEKISPTGLKIDDNYIIMGDAYVSVFTLITYPSIVGVGWLGAVANINNTRLTLTVTPTNSFEISKTLKKSMSEVKSKLINTNDYNDQILLNNKLDDYTELVNRIDREHEKFVSITVNFLCYAKSLDELEKIKKELSNTLISYGLGCSSLMFEQERSLKMCLPTMYSGLEAQYGLPIPLVTLASSFPFVYHNLQDDGDAMVLGNDAFGGLVLFDLWKRTEKRRNSNAVIIGKSGYGKSTFVKKIARANWCRGKKIIMIDPERENKEFCEAVGGCWVDCGTGLNGMINPLEVRLAVDEIDEEDNANNNINLSKHIQTFRTFIKYYLQDLTAYELTKLEEILIEVYADKGITFDTNLSKLKSSDYPIMEDLYNKVCHYLEIEKKNKTSQKAYDTLEKISSLLKRSTIGADSKLFNGTSSIKVDEDKDFIVLDINSLVEADDCILRTQFFNILSWCWNEISKDRNEEVVLIIDEAHLLIDENNKDGLDFLKKLPKRIRKYNGALLIISQNWLDFCDPKIQRYGQVIIDNANYIFTMAQGQKELPAVQEILNLSQSEVNFLSTASKGQGLLTITQDSKIPIQVYLTEEEKELFGKGGGR